MRTRTAIRLGRLITAVGATTVLFAATVVPAFAAGTPNQQSCFGQGRSDYATSQPGGAVGDAASSRKGSNAQMNADYRAACQG